MIKPTEIDRVNLRKYKLQDLRSSLQQAKEKMCAVAKQSSAWNIKYTGYRTEKYQQLHDRTLDNTIIMVIHKCFVLSDNV